jgi:hypothetical protein
MRILIIILIIGNSILINAQNQRGQTWISGLGGTKIIFSNNGIVTDNTPMNSFYFSHGNSNICDTNGNLLLSSDGFKIYDSNYNILDNGDTLVPKDFFINEDGWSAYSQSSIFLPMDSEKYYFITPTMNDSRLTDCLQNNHCYFDLLLYNIIDMKANNGAGKVVKRMIPLLENVNLRKTQMMACQHGNGKDWWLLKQEGDSANVHIFLFTQDSVYDKGVQVFNEPVWGGWDIRGQSTFNNDGTQYATTSHGSSTGLIFLADFDRCYGKLSNPKTIQMPYGSQHKPADTTIMERLSVGLAFSPNGKFLYVISMSNVYQYDLIDNTWFHVAGLDTNYQQFQLYENAYLGPDNNIYIGNFAVASLQMSVIDNPDIKGAGCNFCPRCLRLDSLSGFVRAGTPPCMPNYGLGAKVCYPDGLLNPPKEDLNTLEVFPNPSSTIFYIKNKKGKKKELYNTIGELVLSTTKDEVNVSSLPKGFYYIKCENVVKKVIVE